MKSDKQTLARHHHFYNEHFQRRDDLRLSNNSYCLEWWNAFLYAMVKQIHSNV